MRHEESTPWRATKTGYAVGDENKDKLIKRLNRIEGQVRGVKGTVEDERIVIRGVRTTSVRYPLGLPPGSGPNMVVRNGSSSASWCDGGRE